MCAGASALSCSDISSFSFCENAVHELGAVLHKLDSYPCCRSSYRGCSRVAVFGLAKMSVRSTHSNTQFQAKTFFFIFRQQKRKEVKCVCVGGGGGLWKLVLLQTQLSLLQKVTLFSPHYQAWAIFPVRLLRTVAPNIGIVQW